MGKSGYHRIDEAVFISEDASFSAFQKNVIIRPVAGSVFDFIESPPDEDVIKPHLILRGAGFAPVLYI